MGFFDLQQLIVLCLHIQKRCKGSEIFPYLKINKVKSFIFARNICIRRKKQALNFDILRFCCIFAE